ncbi:MAG: hypothetical protein IIB39_00060 [Candidatus Marinimicrobia bacterium]|nr:hypothetical protein [Candidatus Neomarinimicrobiota bacterium]
MWNGDACHPRMAGAEETARRGNSLVDEFTSVSGARYQRLVQVVRTEVAEDGRGR